MTEYSELLKQLPFQRESFYGLGLSWYGFDKLGQLAVLVGGDVSLPLEIFRHKSKYMELYEFFVNLPRITSARLVERLSGRKTFSGRPVDYSDELAVAECGVYFIEEDISEFKDEYEQYYLTAIPNEKLNINDLPSGIRQLLEPYHFPIDFSELEQIARIDVSKYLRCK